MSALFHGKRIAVFGGTSGIGRAVARAAWAEGAEVVVIGRSLQPGAHAALDVSQERQVSSFFAGQDPFHHVVSTVGVSAPRKMLARETRENGEDRFGVKFWGQFHILKHAALRLPEGGSVTLTTGIDPRRAAPGFGMAAAVSGALETLVRTAVVEYAPVRVNAVCPGNVASGKLFSQLSPEAMFSRVRGPESEPAPAGSPDEAAQGYLLAMAGRHMNGQILVLDGGVSVC